MMSRHGAPHGQVLQPTGTVKDSQVPSKQTSSVLHGLSIAQSLPQWSGSLRIAAQRFAAVQ